MSNLMQMTQAHDRFIRRTVPFRARDRQTVSLAIAVNDKPVVIDQKKLMPLQGVEFVAALVDIPVGPLFRRPTAWLNLHRISVRYGVPMIRPQDCIGEGVDAGALDARFLRKFPRLGKLVLALQWASTTSASTRRDWVEARKELRQLFGDSEDGVLLGNQRFSRSLMVNRRQWEPTFYLAVPLTLKDKLWAAVTGEGSWGDKHGNVSSKLGEAFIGHLLDSGGEGWLREFRRDEMWGQYRKRYGTKRVDAIQHWFRAQVLVLDHLLYVPGKLASPAAYLANPDEMALDVTPLADFFLQEEEAYLVPPVVSPRQGDRYRFSLGEIDINVCPQPMMQYA